MPNQYVNKVQFGDQTVMDITDTSADAQDVLEGEVFYNAAGVRTVGALGDATQSTHGLMSAADKQKLDTIIDDTADSTSTTSTWSAAKVAQELAAAVPTSISDLTNDSDFLTEALLGANSGIATLDASGKIPSSQLPSYVDDVVEYDSSANFPATGEASKIYVDTTSNKTYRWGGSEYVEISESLALGETDSTAYRGDRGKVAYDHAAAKGTAYASGLYKITTNAEGHVTTAEAVTKTDITGLGIPAQDTTYQSLAAAENGTDISLVSTGEKYVWNSKASGDHTHSYAGSSSAGGAATNVNITTAAPTTGSIAGYVTLTPTISGSNTLLAEDSLFLYNSVSNSTITYSWLNVGKQGVIQGAITLFSTNSKKGDIKTASLTANQTYTLPNATGTIALTSSDITGTAAKATADADGNTISSTYLKLSGGTVTGATTIKNILTLYREGTTTDNPSASLQFIVKDTTINQEQNTAYIAAYNTHAANNNGMNMVINSSGNMFIGGGESPGEMYKLKSTGENLYLTSDNILYAYGNANTIANRIGFAVTTAGAIVPQKAEAINNNVQDIGASDNKWANVYATTFNGALSGNATTATTADKLTGFSSRASTMTWGNQTGSVITCFATSGGGGWGFRDDNPASGQTSMTIDGTVYIKEGGVDIGTAVKSFSVSGTTVTYTTLWGNTGTFTTSDTKNTAGSTNNTSKLFLIGATSQAANPTTNSYQYTYTNNGLLSALKLGLNLNGTEKAHLEWNDTDQSIDFIFA